MGMINTFNKNEKKIPSLYVKYFVIQDVFSTGITHNSSKNKSQFRELQKSTVYYDSHCVHSYSQQTIRNVYRFASTQSDQTISQYELEQQPLHGT